MCVFSFFFVPTIPKNILGTLQMALANAYDDECYIYRFKKTYLNKHTI